MLYHQQKLIPRAPQQPLFFTKNMQYAIMGWTPQAQDFQAFHNKHFVFSPSFINRDFGLFPSLLLWKPPLSPSQQS